MVDTEPRLMASLREGDPVAYALSRAREYEAERIAELVGVPLGKVRSWRKGTLSLSPWVIRVIATC
jgi:DNA-directed RNA polymerase specialized sigma24 family protein